MTEELDFLQRIYTWDLVPLHLVLFLSAVDWSIESRLEPLVVLSATKHVLLLVVLVRIRCDNAFLYGDLSESIYMILPPGFSHPSQHVCHLRRAIYGSNRLLVPSLSGFAMCDDVDIVLSLKQQLHTEFQMKDLSPLCYFLGLERLSSSDGELLPDPTHYRALIGALVYLTITWLDIAYDVHVLSQLCAYYDDDWILMDFGVSISVPTHIYCDNQSAIKIAANPIFHECTKYLEIALHFVYHRYLAGSILLPYVVSTQKLTDLFTKAHTVSRFKFLVDKLLVYDPS
ncbi:uncharacterized protein LOC120282189 [Dioscorea cayenensis subsp. rotundata]|uniref:Uncharacterized protein LOC120282189 n=1 Tax=Dioscorea cayennensis subsp. rotundata TaxID=55577 RepID=A0AB40CXQ2_DIOCR|nr:uncharacterized protein LOC120282189 [Dioscorea cayenensis subsp. rotundata]